MAARYSEMLSIYIFVGKGCSLQFRENRSYGDMVQFANILSSTTSSGRYLLSTMIDPAIAFEIFAYSSLKCALKIYFS